MTITPPTPATPATPAPEKMILTPQRKVNKPRGEQAARTQAATTPQPQKVASDETNWRTKSPNQAAGWDTWQSRREKGGPDRDKWKYIMPASLITTPIPDLTPPEEPDNKFSTPKKVPSETPQRTMRRSLEQIQKAAASSPLCPPPPMPRSAYKTSPAKQKEGSPLPAKHKDRPHVDKERVSDMKDLEQEPSFDVSDFPSWDPDTDVNSLWDTLSASKESAIYEVRQNRHSPGFSTEEKVKRPLFTNSEDDNSRPSTPRRHRSESSVSPERTPLPASPTFSPESMTTPLKKKSSSKNEAKNERSQNRSSARRAESVPSSPVAPEAEVVEDAADYENTHVINSPDFNAHDDENENLLCTSPVRDASMIPDTPIADLSPIGVGSAEEMVQLSHSSNPSPLATRAIQPFPTFTIEEASIEGESPVSEKKMSKMSSSPSAASVELSECFAALASSNIVDPEPAVSPTDIAAPSTPASLPPLQQELSFPSPVAPVSFSPSSSSIPLSSSAPMPSQPPLSPVAVAQPTTQELPRAANQAQPQQTSLLATVGGVNAFLIVFIAVLFAFLLTDFF